MGGPVVTVVLGVGVLIGWWLRWLWGGYKVRRYFERIQRENEKARLRELEKEYDRRENRTSGTNGWTK